jgi:hypothetical protein
MRMHAKYFFITLSLVACLALPLWAHTDSASFTVTGPTTIAGKQLKPGTYRLEVKPDQTSLKIIDVDSDKTIAEVACRWVTIKSAPTNTEVILNGDKVTQIQFNGKTQAVDLG